jgi:Lrp/AsnC family transcriptional regulator for asnA, asnC and gidA
MDEIDLEIIRILSKDARMPFKNLAKKLGIGVDSVVRRYDKLQKAGVILYPTIILDLQSCGFEGQAGFLIKIDPDSNYELILNELKNTPNAFLVGEMWGDYEFYIESYFATFDDIQTLVKSLQKINGILSVDCFFFTRKDWPISDFFNFSYADFPISMELIK